MEIRLATIEERFPKDSTQISFEDDLSIREYNALQNAINQINKYKSNKRLIEIVFANNEEIESFFKDAFQHLLKKSVSWAATKEEDMDVIFLHANRLLLNYLSSIRTYIDHSLLFLSREYGKESGQLIKFKKLLAFNFDNNFSYRFFYKLRNYAQHCGVPLDTINFDSTYDRENNKIHGHLQAIFDSKKLLEDYDGWGKTLTKDLSNATESFELRALRASMNPIMFNLNYNFKKINRSRTKKAAVYIANKIGHLIKAKKEPCILYDVKTNEQGHVAKFEIIAIPLKEVTEILAE